MDRKSGIPAVNQKARTNRMATVTKQEQAMILMVALDEGFRSTTYEDLAAMERLLNGEVPGGTRDYWKGLRHRPLTWWKPLLYFITGVERENHLPSVAGELGLEGGTLFLRDVLKWAMDVNLMHARFSGGHHPFEPECARVDPGPCYGAWKFTAGGLLAGLARAFSEASPEEVHALETLRRRTEGRNRAGELMSDGLGDQPFYFWRLIAYFRTGGSRSYTFGEVENDVMVQGPGNKGFMHHEHIRAFLSWASQKQVLNVSWGSRTPGTEDRSASFHVDVTPLIERWTL